MFTAALDPGAKRAMGLIARSSAASAFLLAGGTGAALQLGHRISVDLDFFCTNAFEPAALAATLSAGGVDLQKRVESPGTLKGIVGATQVSFFYYPYEWIEPPVEFQGVRLASLLDIALMKMTAIGARGAKRDFVDLFFILQKTGQRDLFPLLAKKYSQDQVNLYHFVRSLVYFYDAEGEGDPRMLVAWNWNEIKRFFERWVQEFPAA